MSKKFQKIKGFLILSAFLALIAPNLSFANPLTDISVWAIKKILFAIVYAISFVFGIFIAIETWIVEVILDINKNITSSSAVKAGFPVVLSIANLGFVAVIIIIAIATIIRWERYGMKQILSKLIIAAVLVNFSLTIAGSILNIADSFTTYFVDQISPSEQGFHDFAKSFAAAFQPQQLFIFKPEEAEDPGKAIKSANFKKGTTTGDFTIFLSAYASLFGSLIALAAILITMATLIVLFIIRYVYLSILLIIMPFAWLAWVIPNLQNHWTNWWNTFLRWTFFAPIVVLFLWIAIMTGSAFVENSEGVSQINEGVIIKNSTENNDVWDSIGQILGGPLTAVFVNLLKTTVLIGLMVGGMIAANSMSIAGAQYALGAIKGAAKGALGVAAKLPSGYLSRVATKPPPPADASKLKKAWHNYGPGGWLRFAAQHPIAKQMGVTAALAEYGAKTDYWGRWKQKRKKGAELRKEIEETKRKEKDLMSNKSDYEKWRKEKENKEKKLGKLKEEGKGETEEAKKLMNEIAESERMMATLKPFIEDAEKEINERKEKEAQKIKEYNDVYRELNKENPGLFGAIWRGATSGSGLFGKAGGYPVMSKAELEALGRSAGWALSQGIKVVEKKEAPSRINKQQAKALAEALGRPLEEMVEQLKEMKIDVTDYKEKKKGGAEQKKA